MITTDSITKSGSSVVYATRPLEGPGLLMGTDPIGLNQIIDALEPLPSRDGLLTLSSMRNQLTVTIGPDRLVFEDHSGEEPTRADFPERVAKAAEYIGIQSNQVYAAIGLNFDLESESDDEDELPSKAMLGRTVKEDILDEIGYDVIGASARLWYVARNRVHDLRIEPTGGQYGGREYYAHLNVHMVLAGSPLSGKWLSQVLDEEYIDFKRVLTKLLEPGERGNGNND